MKSPEEEPPPIFHEVAVEGALIRGLPVRAESAPTPLRHFNSQIWAFLLNLRPLCCVIPDQKLKLRSLILRQFAELDTVSP